MEKWWAEEGPVPWSCPRAATDSCLLKKSSAPDGRVGRGAGRSVACGDAGGKSVAAAGLPTCFWLLVNRLSALHGILIMEGAHVQ